MDEQDVRERLADAEKRLSEVGELAVWARAGEQANYAQLEVLWRCYRAARLDLARWRWVLGEEAKP